MFHRLGDGALPDAKLQVVPVQVTSHVLLALSSGREPSIILSIDPELSTRNRTFGLGGLRSSCCACAGSAARLPTATSIEDAAIRPTNRILMTPSSSSSSGY